MNKTIIGLILTFTLIHVNSFEYVSIEVFQIACEWNVLHLKTTTTKKKTACHGDTFMHVSFIY